MEAPERIYLQYHGSEPPNGGDDVCESEVTHTLRDPVYDHDVPYIRADIRDHEVFKLRNLLESVRRTITFDGPDEHLQKRIDEALCVSPEEWEKIEEEALQKCIEIVSGLDETAVQALDRWAELMVNDISEDRFLT